MARSSPSSTPWHPVPVPPPSPLYHPYPRTVPDSSTLDETPVPTGVAGSVRLRGPPGTESVTGTIGVVPTPTPEPPPRHRTGEKPDGTKIPEK